MKAAKIVERILLIIVMIFFSSYAHANTLVVHSPNTIQGAIDAASSGDTVVVSAGTYNESIDMKYGVSVIGAGPADSIIDAGGSTYVVYCNNIGNGTAISGFTMMNASIGIWCSNSSPDIVSNRITNITGTPAMYGHGILLDDSSPQILKNVIFDINGTGILADGNSEPEIINNTIFKYRYYAGISFASSNIGTVSPIIRNNIIYRDTTQSAGGVAWNVDAGATPAISYNDVFNPGAVFDSSPAYYFYYEDVSWQHGSGGTGALTADPVFVNETTGDLHLDVGSPCINAGDPDPMYDDPDYSQNDMGAYGGPESDYLTVWFVDGEDGDDLSSGLSWPDAKETIQAAIAAASAGDEIWVKEGTYVPGSERTDTFLLKSGVELYGGFNRTESNRDQRDWNANVTVLSGDINGDDTDFTNNGENVYHVVTGAEGATLDGFTVTGGNADGSLPHNRGAGIYNDSSSPMIANCSIRGNQAEGDGGGMYNDQSSPTVTNCTFADNVADAGGGIANFNSSPTVTDCAFTGNIATTFNGGGMYNDQSSPTVTNCTFADNVADAGGGMSNFPQSSPTVTNCTFSYNSARAAGGMHNQFNSSPTVTNCIFTGNIAYNDNGGMINHTDSNAILTNCIFTGNSAGNTVGGIQNAGSVVTLTNCTFSGNTAIDDYGGMWDRANSNSTVTNCIFWGNTPNEITVYQSAPTITYSDVQGGWTGTGNINADPLFMDVTDPDPANWDLHLLAGSPCIDTGDNTAISADVAPASTISYWKLDEVAGPDYLDSVATNDGHSTGTTPTESPIAITGVVGGGQAFGTDTGINVPDDSSFDFSATDSFSIECWVKGDPLTPGDTQVFVGRRDLSLDFNWFIGIRPSGAAVFNLDKNGEGGWVEGTTNLSDGTWHHVVGVRDADANLNRLYLDGVLVGSLPAIYTSGFDSSVNLNIGYLDVGEGTKFFNFEGDLDEIALYSKALTAVEIADHYDAALAGHGIDWVTTDFEGEQRIFNGTVDMGADEFVDSDTDLLPDSWELDYFGNLSYDGADDLDGDGLTNAQEIQYGTDPNDPDSDDDGVLDGIEVAYGNNPNAPDSGSVSGIVTISGGAPIDNLWVHVFSLGCGGTWLGGTHTNATGNYTIDGLPAGEVYVQTCAGCDEMYYIDEWYDGSTGSGTLDCNNATPVTVASGDTTPDINFALDMGGAISGTVTTSGGDPIAGMTVNAWLGKCDEGHLRGARTDMDGNYILWGLPAGDVYVRTCPESAQMNYIQEWYDDQTDCNAATPISVNQGGTTGDIDFELEEGFTIQGSVKNVHMPDNNFGTLLDVIIGNDFFGTLPDDITSIIIKDPGGLPVASDLTGFTYYSQYRNFYIQLPEKPKIGIYTFEVTDVAGAVGTATDYQYVLRTLPIPDESKLSPADEATATSKTPTFSWDPIEYTDEDIAIYYRLEIWDADYTERVFATGFVQDMLHYTLPVGILETGKSYEWRVRVTDGSDWIQVQNRSVCDWMTVNIAHTLLPHSAPPAIDLDGWGVLSWTWDTGHTGTECWVRIYDHDGIASDGSSHTVTIQRPGDTQPYLMYFVRSYGQNSAGYEYWFDSLPVVGDYTFTVTDPDGIVATLTETLDPSDINPLDPPVESLITPNLLTEHLTASFDNVYINGNLTAFEDFNSYDLIDDIDWSKWSWHENASIQRDNGNGWLVLDIGNSVGRANGSLGFANPLPINEIRADITIESTSSDAPGAEIAGTWCHNGVGDVFAKITVTSDRVYYSVSQQYINEQETYQWDDLKSGNLLTGGFFNVPVTAEISWNDATSTLTFTANGESSPPYVVSGNIGPPVFDPGKTLRTRINLVTDTTPTFTWAPVTNANRYRLRIYNYTNNNIWSGYTGNEPSYTLPPGILKPNSYYRFRLEAWDAHDPLNVDNLSKTPASNNDNYRFYTGSHVEEDDFPFIDLSSHGVFVWNDEVDGPMLLCWVYVHDAQGVPDNIASVTVTFPGGLVENLEYVTSHPHASYTPTSGPYSVQSFLPITSGPYTFTVVDKDGHSYSISEDLNLQPIAYPDRSTLSPSNNTLVGGTAVNFDWEDVPDVFAGEGFYRVEIYDYDYKRVRDFNTTESQFSLTAGFLKADTVYRYRITTRREFFDQNVDNASACPADYSSMPTFITSLLGSVDGDLMPDGWEIAYGLDTGSNDGALDSDGDLLSNYDEYLNGTDPTIADTDNDGFDDYDEVVIHESDPTSTDLDNNNNGKPDSVDSDDFDNDGVPDVNDNCPNTPNGPVLGPNNQLDFNNDGIGDVCQDSDEDGIKDDVDLCPSDEFNDFDGDQICAGMGYNSPMTGEWDNCPWVANPDQADDDFDTIGDACDIDVSAEKPTCGVGLLPPCHPATTIEDTDGDGLSNEDETNIYGTDPNEADTDNDGVDDGEDNCKLTPNPYDIDADGNGTPDTQTDTDYDGLGNICDPDDDNDGICDAAETWPDGTPGTPTGGCTPNPQNSGDNCPLIANSDQADMDNDGEGDVCDDDIDGDGLSNSEEVALGTSTTNPDTDGDGTDDGEEVADGTDPLTPPGSTVYKIVLSAPSDWMPSLSWDEANQKWVPDEVIVVARFKDPNGDLVDFPVGNVTFTLIPSTWEGVAINDTELHSGDPTNDFSFHATNKDAIIYEETVTTTQVSEISFSLFAFDFGGQAKIMASTLDPNGADAVGEITLPLDSDKDLLPDAFEQANSADGFDHLNAFSLGGSKNDGQEDMDTSADNTHNGDGITNFMEYRGWVSDIPNGNVVNYTWQRLSHTNKDLFVRGDNFGNSIPVSIAPGVLDFSVDHDMVYSAHGGGPSAFEEAGIHVHDVTGMPSFAGPEEPPNIDILVVTNKTERDPDDFYIHTLLGKENGTIDHPSVVKIRHWEWDLKGASYIGDAELYAVLRDAALNPLRQTTETYHLCLMHYIHNRPYIDELGSDACDTGQDYVGKLDPLNKVEDWYLENGADPPDSKGNKKEDCCVTNGSLDGDRMDPDWKTHLYGTREEWHKGQETYLSVFDANKDGLVENPRVDDPLLITKGYTPEMLQLHTVIHEMGHGVGCDEQHTTDLTCVMYQDSPDWDRAGHFCPYALSQIYIHNKTEY